MTDPSGLAGQGVQVGLIMGSDSDWTVMCAAADALRAYGIEYEVRVVSAHRTPHGMLEYASTAAGRGLQVIIAGAGGAAHLPGMIASATTLPVIGVPVALARLDGLDSLLSIVQMPAGVPVATVGIDAAHNAGLLTVRILAVGDRELHRALELAADKLAETVQDKDATLRQLHAAEHEEEG